MSSSQVQKRNGDQVSYDEAKIFAAVCRCFENDLKLSKQDANAQATIVLTAYTTTVKSIIIPH